MINTLADARRYIEENGLKHVQIIGDFYHMNIEEDSLTEALHHNRDLLVMCTSLITTAISRAAAASISPACSISCVPITIRVTSCTSAGCVPTIRLRPIRTLALTCVNAKDDERQECFYTFASARRHHWHRAGCRQSACLVLRHAQ